MTGKLYIWLTAASVGVVLALVGFIVIVGMFAGEYLCEDRHPPWGPPEDPNSSCTGHFYESRHPGSYPWTLPQ